MKKNSFATLFRKYRLKAGFSTLRDFANRLVDEGLIYDESLLSHWQRGTRVPQERNVLFSLVKIFLEKNAIEDLSQANEFFEISECGYLTSAEVKKLSRITGKLTTKVSKEVGNLSLDQRKAIFKYDFKDVPKFFYSNNLLNFVAVVGAGDFEVTKLSYKEKNLRNRYKAHKPCSEYVLLALFDLISNIRVEVNSKIQIVSDVEVSKDIVENNNILCLSGGDVNSFSTRVAVKFEEIYGVRIPIRFSTNFSSDCIYSSLSGNFYIEKEDRENGSEFSAFLTLIPNPWNTEKVIMLAAGNRVLGTVAAIKLIQEVFSMNTVLENNTMFNDVPARVLKSSRVDVSRKRVKEVKLIE